MTPHDHGDDASMMRMLLDSDIDAGSEDAAFANPFAGEADGDLLESDDGGNVIVAGDEPLIYLLEEAPVARTDEPLRAQSLQDPAPDRAGDPVFEATIETFRRNGFPIRPDDETYAVMEFMHLAMRNMEAKFAAERRVEMDRLFSMMKDLNDKNEETAVVLRTLMSEQQEAAATLGKRLMWTAKEAATRFANAFSKLHQDANTKMNQSAQAMVSLAEDEFDKELRKLVRDETRIGLAAGIEVEVGGLAKGVKQATATLTQASKVAAARAGKGWLVNIVEDLKMLPLGGKLGVAGLVVVLLGVLFLRR